MHHLTLNEMSKYIKGEIVNFERNELLNENNIPVAAVVPLELFVVNPAQNYIIANDFGFLPNLERQIQFELNPETKYIFVKESELST